MNKLSELCVIKVNSKGMQLILDPDCDYMDLVEDVCYKFLKSKDFFGQQDLILELKGRTLSDEETKGIIESIHLNSNLHIQLLREGDHLFEPDMKTDSDRFYYEKAMENAKIIKGSVTSDLKADGSLLILGDIKRDVTVTAFGSVTVLGKVYGSIVAGESKNEKAFVISSEFVSDDITLCGYYNPDIFISKSGLFQKKSKKGSFMCVSIFQNDMVLEPLENGILFS